MEYSDADLGSKDTRVRAYHFTLHNYTEKHERDLQEFPCDYMVYGRETCPTTGRKHLQGYMYAKNKLRWSAVCKQFYPIRLFVARGNAKANRKYCTKEDSIGFFERGTLPVQGDRCDLEVVRTHLDSGLPIGDLTYQTNLQGIRFAEIHARYHEPQRTWKTQVVWLWGPSGTGKTTTARAQLPGAFELNVGCKWWDGYDGHENVIMDELRADQFRLPYLFKLFGCGQCTVEVKGGMRQFRAKRIAVTAPYPPDEMFASTGEDMTQILRRIDSIVYCGYTSEIPEPKLATRCTRKEWLATVGTWGNNACGQDEDLQSDERMES